MLPYSSLKIRRVRRTKRTAVQKLLSLYAVFVLMSCIMSVFLMIAQQRHRVNAAERCAANIAAIGQLENDYQLRNGHYGTIEELRRTYPFADTLSPRCPLDGTLYRVTLSSPNTSDQQMDLECIHSVEHARLHGKQHNYQLQERAIICCLP